MENLQNDYTTESTTTIFMKTKAKLKEIGYYYHDKEFKFGKIMEYKTDKEPEFRLRCPYSNNGCGAAIQMTRLGCIEYLCGIEHTWGNARLTVDHDLTRHEDKSKKYISQRSGYKKVTLEEIDKMIIEDGLTQVQIMDRFGKRVKPRELPGVRLKVSQRILKFRGNQTIKNCIDTTPPVLFNGEKSLYCRIIADFLGEDGVKKMVLFGSREQMILLTKGDLIAVDGFFKFRIKGFKQLITFAVFLKNVYVPVCHILLPDKMTSTYNYAFHQLNAIAQNDTSYGVDWSSKTIISDYERGLSAAITNVFKPGIQNHCYFHYIKAVFDNFVEKVPKKLRKNKKEFLKCLKVHPFTWIVEDELQCPREIFIAAAFYFYFGRCKEILPFFRYFVKNWSVERHSFKSDETAVQRTTNGVETLHGVYRYKGIIGIGRLDEFVNSLGDSDSSLYDIYVDSDMRNRVNNPLAWRSVSGSLIIQETQTMIRQTIRNFRKMYKKHPAIWFDSLLDLEEELSKVGEEEEEEDDDIYRNNEEEEEDDDPVDYFIDPEMTIVVEEEPVVMRRRK